jgi:hypothetical protein
MTRKASIDLLLNVNANHRPPLLRDSYAKRSDRQSDDLLRAEINAGLEGLRSVLDYVFHDLKDITRTVGSPGKGGKLYFPYAHPVTKKGRPRTPADVLNEFEHKPLVREIKAQHPAIYLVLKGVQGEKWLSALIGAVNAQKHQDTVKLGPKQRIIGDQEGPKIVLEEGSKIVLHGRHSILTKSKTITGINTLSPDTPLPHDLSDVVRDTEEINPATFQKWLDDLEDWNKRTRALIEAVYQAYPK